MAVVVTTDLFCDGFDEQDRGCPEWFQGVTKGRRAYPSKARMKAQKAGWFITRQGDYCKKCSEKYQLKERAKR